MAGKKKKTKVAPTDGAKGDVIDHSSKLIKTQSQVLKRELENDIDRKLKKKIEIQQTEIQNLRQCIEQLKNDNDEVKMLYTGPKAI